MIGLPLSLLDPSCYDHPVESIECIETHISWVFLTGEFAYKLKKPLKLGFLDFSSLEKRHFYCEEELRLNRRFAPDLYLGVTPICGPSEHPRLNGPGNVLDYAVKMRQFPQSALLDRKLLAGELTPSRIDSIAREIARFHLANSGDVPPGIGDPDHVLQQAMDNFEQIKEGSDWTDALAALQSWSAVTFALHRHHFESRLQSGFIRECHGDLHLGNMAWLDDQPILFDCIEFSPELRWIDIISDLAFTVMDFHDHGRPELAHRFLNAWLEQTGDHDGLAILPWYLVYRAMVRAKVAHIRARQAPLEHSSFTDYLALAERFTRPSPKWLLITYGYSGSGKTTLSQQLLERTGAIRIRSDIERKRLFGLSPGARSHSPTDQGIYTPEAHRMAYQRLETLARSIIQAGYPVIVDAAFLKRAERDTFHALANELGVPFRILELKADEAELRVRVRAREQSGADASEATLDVLEKQLLFSEAIAEDEYPFRLVCLSSDNMADELQRLEYQISSMT
ncbi:MAG: AAA family ATPase [Sulfuricellaceae bacterium]|nr:AAA family ATPase [Sulfuricellaceae bacterium]